MVSPFGPPLRDTFLKAAGEKMPGVPEGTPGIFEGGALDPGPQAPLWEPFPCFFLLR